MTLIEMKASKEVFLNAADIADLVGSDAQQIRAQAQSDQRKLGFPVMVIGKRVKVPRRPFLEWIGEGETAND